MRILSRLLLRLTESVESELLASNTLLIAQVKALQTQLGKPPRLSDAQKIELARLAKGLSPEVREQMRLVPRPSTMLGWYRRLIACQYDGSSQRQGPGRPRLRAQTEALILQLSRENPRWGAQKIRGALKHVNIKVCHQTIQNVLKRNGYHPAPRHEAEESWARFLRIHAAVTVSTDFFTATVLTFRGLLTFYVLFVMDLDRRCVEVAGITLHPNEAWMMQVARNLTSSDDGFLQGKSRIIMDRDAKFTRQFRSYLRREGIEVIRLPPLSPNLNAHAERWVRSIKHECLDQVILIGKASLQKAVREYVAHYNAERVHQGIQQEIPIPLEINTERNMPVQCTSRLGGLLTFYH